MSDPTPVDWLALCMATEGRDHEWPYIGCVVLNRTEHRSFLVSRRLGLGTGADETVGLIEKAVRQPYQFSAFNDTMLLPAPEAYRELTDRVNQIDPGILERANDYAKWLFSLSSRQRHGLFLGPKVLHFWSPISMDPQWSAPRWAAGMRWIVPFGIDGRRFIFGESE